MNYKEKARPRANADRASKVFRLATERFEDTPNALSLQARNLAVRFGLTPHLAEMAFSTGRRGDGRRYPL
jgi:hypothetical protein